MGRFRLVVFDVDGTVVSARSSWQFLHERLGTWDAAKKNRQRFLRGEISYDEWAKLDASLWKGVSLRKVCGLLDSIPLMKGAKETLKTLRNCGVKVALLSAGVSLLAERIHREIGVDFFLANELEVLSGYLTGNVRVNLAINSKHYGLERVMGKFSVTADQCVAVGDDETLIPVFKIVAKAIAFNAVSKAVEKNAHVIIRKRDLREVLPHVLRKH